MGLREFWYGSGRVELVLLDKLGTFRNLTGNYLGVNTFSQSLIIFLLRCDRCNCDVFTFNDLDVVHIVENLRVVGPIHHSLFVVIFS
jgi:hypothetical protein